MGYEPKRFEPKGFTQVKEVIETTDSQEVNKLLSSGFKLLYLNTCNLKSSPHIKAITYVLGRF